MATVKPQVIDDEEHERVYERVAAVDVAKDSGMVCARTPHPSRPGGRQSAVWTVKARRNAIAKLGRQLSQDGIEMVTLESTSDYWRIWLYVRDFARKEWPLRGSPADVKCHAVLRSAGG